MKTFLLTFLLIASSCYAGIYQVILERNAPFDVPSFNADGSVKSTKHYDASVTAKVYGILPNGAAKTVNITSAEMQAVTDVENCSLFALNRSAIRAIVSFNADGSLQQINFHMGDNFEVKQFGLDQRPAPTPPVAPTEPTGDQPVPPKVPADDADDITVAAYNGALACYTDAKASFDSQWASFYTAQAKFNGDTASFPDRVAKWNVCKAKRDQVLVQAGKLQTLIASKL